MLSMFDVNTIDGFYNLALDYPEQRGLKKECEDVSISISNYKTLKVKKWQIFKYTQIILHNFLIVY